MPVRKHRYLYALEKFNKLAPINLQRNSSDSQSLTIYTWCIVMKILLRKDDETAAAAAHISNAFIGIFHASLNWSLPECRKKNGRRRDKEHHSRDARESTTAMQRR